jgi:hypothetical protein
MTRHTEIKTEGTAPRFAPLLNGGEMSVLV